MHKPETCPACSAQFPARKALLSSGVPLGFNVFTFSKIVVQVRCPECRHVFPARHIRFFGLFSPSGLRWLVLALVAALGIASCIVQ
ncbi:MAG: hypothetical protein REI12_05890 [Pedobacter sp.]|nr:hypothetical protein [Pedobacter sp.]